ncbi:MAG TPA: electron transfer flavoprotein subunit alpha/FixB family protein [Kineosporiaceae bacterium]|nr:electron transfer flavoprotein subunit alpha/FixB family protein [Kineosporiaceae bacterium]
MILVLVEPEAGAGMDGGTELISLEALTFARSLATAVAAGSGSDDAAVEALVVGPHPSGMLAELAAQGVGVVHHAADPRLASYSAAAWAASLAEVVAATGPAAVLAAGSPRGSEVLAHLAARLNLPMAANCVTVRPNGDGLLASRQVMGGSALEEVRLIGGPGSPALLTMAGHAVEPVAAEAATSPEVRTFTPQLSDTDLVARVRGLEPVRTGGADLTKARVVVGAGRGVGGPERFGDLLELADLLGGALGVSRVVTSLGWRPHHEQVGQTGSRISPDVYLACGISGAIQHWAGCAGARTIIAINTDAEAPMVTKADYAVIGDLHEIVPAIVEELRTRLA